MRIVRAAMFAAVIVTLGSCRLVAPSGLSDRAVTVTAMVQEDLSSTASIDESGRPFLVELYARIDGSISSTPLVEGTVLNWLTRDISDTIGAGTATFTLYVTPYNDADELLDSIKLPLADLREHTGNADIRIVSDHQGITAVLLVQHF